MLVKKCLIKSGRTVWLRDEDGRLRDIGPLQGDALASWAVQNRVPIMRSPADVAMLDGRHLHRRRVRSSENRKA